MVRLQIANNGERRQEYEGRYGCQSNEGEVDGAVQALTPAAVLTLGEVCLVVAAHLGEDARNIVSPTGENIADDLINALSLHAVLKPEWLERLRLRCQHQAIVQQVTPVRKCPLRRI